MPATPIVYLSTPCAAPDCGHPYNWHTAGACTVETCQCVAFAIGAQSPDPARKESGHAR